MRDVQCLLMHDICRRLFGTQGLNQYVSCLSVAILEHSIGKTEEDLCGETQMLAKYVHEK